MGRIAASAFMSLRTTIPFSAYHYAIPSRELGLALHSPFVPSAVSSRPAITNNAMSASTSSDANIEVDIASNIASVRQRIDDAVSANGRPQGSVRLVAVSKTKPIEFLQVAYEVSKTWWKCWSLIREVNRLMTTIQIHLFTEWTALFWRKLCTGTYDQGQSFTRRRVLAFHRTTSI